MDPEIIKIVKFLIKETPIGHLRSTLDNLKTIIGGEVLDSEEVLNEIKTYEEEHLKQLNVGQDKIIISHFNKDSEGDYIFQNKNLKVKTIPMSENLDKIENVSIEESNLRTLLTNKMEEYKKKNFEDKITATNGKNNI